MGKLIDSTVQTVRKIATGLRPEMLDDMGLIAAVGWQAKEFQKRTGIRCRVKLPPEVKLDIDVSTTMFRIFQEILTNVARHARATRVSLSVAIDGTSIVLRVSDDGCGIGEHDRHKPGCFGLLRVAERLAGLGGTLRVLGVAGSGTLLQASVPLSRGARQGTSAGSSGSDGRGSSA
jgi:signal transduction histidine kinase